MREVSRKSCSFFRQALFGVFLVVPLLSACSDGGSRSGSQGEDTPPGDYSYLYAYNAYRLDGHTTRWPSTTIPVYGATGVGWQEAINRWPAVRFQFVATKPSSGIDILGFDDLGNICGLSSFSYNSAGKMERCKVTINILHNEMNCGLVTDTLTHEIGHCIGVFKHTRDGGLMDEKASGSSDITSAVTEMLSLLYTLAPGADISDKLIARRPGKTREKSRYQPDGKTRYNGGLAVLTRH